MILLITTTNLSLVDIKYICYIMISIIFNFHPLTYIDNLGQDHKCTHGHPVQQWSIGEEFSYSHEILPLPIITSTKNYFSSKITFAWLKPQAKNICPMGFFLSVKLQNCLSQKFLILCLYLCLPGNLTLPNRMQRKRWWSFQVFCPIIPCQ